MANAVPFRHFAPEDSRDDLHRKLDKAPEVHAGAILEALKLLENLHQQGLLDLANGLLSASGKIIDRTTDVIASPQAIVGLRAVLMFGDLLNTLDVEELDRALHPDKRASSLGSITKLLIEEDTRRGMAAALGLLNVFGRALKKD